MYVYVYFWMQWTIGIHSRVIPTYYLDYSQSNDVRVGGACLLPKGQHSGSCIPETLILTSSNWHAHQKTQSNSVWRWRSVYMVHTYADICTRIECTQKAGSRCTEDAPWHTQSSMKSNYVSLWDALLDRHVQLSHVRTYVCIWAPNTVLSLD